MGPPKAKADPKPKKPPAKKGRPRKKAAPKTTPATKLTADLVERVCISLRAGVPIEVAAQAAGISEATYYRWRERGELKGRTNKPYRDFLAATDIARAEGEDELVATITKQAKTSWRAAAWILERRYPERYAPAPVGRPRKDGGNDGEHADPIAQARDELAQRRAART